MKYKAWVDRIENDKIVLEYDGKIINVPKEMIPDAKEGDCILISLEKSSSEKKKREETIKDLMNDLWTD